MLQAKLVSMFDFMPVAIPLMRQYERAADVKSSMLRAVRPELEWSRCPKYASNNTDLFTCQRKVFNMFLGLFVMLVVGVVFLSVYTVCFIIIVIITCIIYFFAH